MAFLLARVSYLRSRGRYSKAMETIDKLYAMRFANKPSPTFAPDINLVCAAVAFELNDRMITFEAAKVALEQLRSPGTHTRNRFDQQDIEYMMYYCKLLLLNSTRNFDSPEFDLARSIDIKYATLNADAVKPLLRKNFPVSEASVAKFDALASENSTR